ncbi:MAG: pyridoxal phosphate-dependent aminotransferase [Deltaproteobacteria bacterium]|nr:pyridoxal phosphate-dependent aminotransferase [Deltaproteobacteria bacterium]
MNDLRSAFDAVTAAELHQSSRIKWTLYGPDVLPAWVADMDFPVAPAIRQAVQALVERNDLGYHAVPLSPELRETFVSRMAERFSWQVDPRSVWPLVNVVQGLDASILLHTKPGQGVIVQTPIYPPFLAAVEHSERRLVENPLVRGASRFEIDFDQLEASIDDDTRLFMLCNPHNPTGRAFERSELLQLGEIVLRHDLIVVSDEIHGDLVYAGHEHVPFASLSPELAERTITLTAATKAFNIAGLPIAFAVFGSQELKQPFRKLPPHVLGHGGILDDAATLAAWTDGQAWLDAVLSYLAENRQRVIAFFSERFPGVRLLPPDATYLAWLDFQELDLPGNPREFFLERGRVALSPGSDFGSQGERCARLNFATSKNILEAILERMAKALES